MSSPLIIALDREKKRRRKRKTVVRQEIGDLVKSLFKDEMDVETLTTVMEAL